MSVPPTPPAPQAQALALQQQQQQSGSFTPSQSMVSAAPAPMQQQYGMPNQQQQMMAQQQQQQYPPPSQASGASSMPPSPQQNFSVPQTPQAQGQQLQMMQPPPPPAGGAVPSPMQQQQAVQPPPPPAPLVHNSLRQSGAIGLPPTGQMPPHKKKVFIEVRNGYISNEIYKQHTQHHFGGAGDAAAGGEENKKDLFDQALERVGFASDYDAKEYEGLVASIIDYIRRAADLLGGFAAGFSAFMLLAVYVDSGNSNSEFFLMVYSTYYRSMQKAFMLLSVFLIITMLAPFSFELAMKSPNRTFTPEGITSAISGGGGGGGGDKTTGSATNPTQQQTIGANKGPQLPSLRDVFQSSSSSPYRHLVNLRFIIYVVCLACTIVITSVEQQRDEDDIKALSSAEVSRLHIAIVLRGILHIIAWLLLLVNPAASVSVIPPESAAAVLQQQQQGGGVGVVQQGSSGVGAGALTTGGLSSTRSSNDAQAGASHVAFRAH